METPDRTPGPKTDDPAPAAVAGSPSASEAIAPPLKDAVTRRSMTPAAARARHLALLEYALNAARAEEAVRAVRLTKATKKNREKRSTRLLEVRDEIAELTVLLQGIRELQARSRPPAGKRTTAAPRPRAKPSASAAGRKAAATSGARND